GCSEDPGRARRGAGRQVRYLDRGRPEIGAGFRPRRAVRGRPLLPEDRRAQARAWRLGAWAFPLSPHALPRRREGRTRTEAGSGTSGRAAGRVARTGTEPRHRLARQGVPGHTGHIENESGRAVVAAVAADSGYRPTEARAERPLPHVRVQAAVP